MHAYLVEKELSISVAREAVVVGLHTAHIVRLRRR